MELKEVTSFERLEKFLKQQNHYVNHFELDVIQWLLQFLEERQLFFLIKDSHFSGVPRLMPNRHALCIFMEKYKKEIQGKYDRHQIKGIVVKNGENFWMKDPKSDEKFPLFPSQDDLLEQEYADDKVFPFFKEGADYITLYEDETVQIIIFLLKRQRFFCKNKEENIYVIEENGYYVKEEDPFLIYPYDSPYTYSFSVYPYSEIKERWTLEQIKQAKIYYEKQKHDLENFFLEKRDKSLKRINH